MLVRTIVPEEDEPLSSDCPVKGKARTTTSKVISKAADLRIWWFLTGNSIEL